MSWPTLNLSEGCDILETEIASIGISEGIPQPTSTKQPNCSRWVTLAGIISPGVKLSMYSDLHCSWTILLDKTAVSFPFLSQLIAIILKQTGLLTFDIRAISRVVPSSIPIAPSILGIIPFIQGKSIIILCSPSQTLTRPSSIFPPAMASCKPADEAIRRLFSAVFIRQPSGWYAFIYSLPFRFLWIFDFYFLTVTLIPCLYSYSIKTRFINYQVFSVTACTAD